MGQMTTPTVHMGIEFYLTIPLKFHWCHREFYPACQKLVTNIYADRLQMTSLFYHTASDYEDLNDKGHVQR